jgi:hypothetical protein
VSKISHMEKIILYTKKIELNFNEQSVATIDVSDMIEELMKEYDLLDRNPVITIDGKFQYVTLKLSPKKEIRTVGFNR